MRSEVKFFLNGREHRVGGRGATMMLADYLRQELGLTGTKIVCAEGDCGACTVLRAFPYGVAGDGFRFETMNSCVALVAQMDGASIVTVDAFRPILNPVQKAMVQCHGSQCGFCTPGFVMALSGLVERTRSSGAKKLEPSAVKNALTGNLCRCTGYQSIIDAALSIDLAAVESLEKRYLSPEIRKQMNSICKKGLLMESEAGADGLSFFAPTTLRELLKYLSRHRDAVLLSGGTDLGVLHNKRKSRMARVVSLHLIPELYKYRAGSRIFVGARVTLSELRHELQKSVPEFSRFLDLFASPQIKNIATLVGNVGNASPIADTPPFLLVCGARIHAARWSGGRIAKRLIPIERFYLGYRKTALKEGEVITGIDFEAPSKRGEVLILEKVSQRKDLDISTVNLAVRVMKTAGVRSGSGAGTNRSEIRIAMGGVAATPIRLPKTEKAVQKSMRFESGEASTLQTEFNPISDLRASATYRRVVAENILRRALKEGLK